MANDEADFEKRSEDRGRQERYEDDRRDDRRDERERSRSPPQKDGGMTGVACRWNGRGFGFIKPYVSPGCRRDFF